MRRTTAVGIGLGLLLGGGAVVLGTLWPVFPRATLRPLAPPVLSPSAPREEAETAAVPQPERRRAPGRHSNYEEARNLIADGRYAEAEAVAPWGCLNRLLTEAAQEANRQGRPDKARAHCRAYLAYFPFESLEWQRQRQEWNKIAFRYVDLLRTAGSHDVPARAAQDVAAVETYKQLDERCGAGDLAGVLRLADAIVRTWPQSLFADAARRLLVPTYLAANKPDEALAAVRALEQDALPDEDFSGALLEVARGYFASKDWHKSFALMDEAVRRFPDSHNVPVCLLGMAETCEKRGDEEQMVAFYRRVAGLPRVETRTNVMDASDTCNRAHEFLGRYYVQKEVWEEALKWWESWQPGSWCGTCAMSMAREKANAITVCRAKILQAAKQDNEAIRVLEAHVFDKEAGGADPQVPIMLVDAHRRRGTLDELARRLSAYRPGYKSTAAEDIACGYIPLIRLGEKKDIEGLWGRISGRVFESDRGPLWHSEQAARILATLGPQARASALARLKADGPEARWACLVLAMMKDPEALALLRGRIDNKKTSYDSLEDCFWALSRLETAEARALLASYAEREGGGNAVSASRHIMARIPRWAPAKP